MKRYYKYKVEYNRTACGHTSYTDFTVHAPSLKVAKTDVARWERYSNKPGVIVKVTSVKRV